MESRRSLMAGSEDMKCLTIRSDLLIHCYTMNEQWRRTQPVRLREQPQESMYGIVLLTATTSLEAPGIKWKPSRR